MTDTIKECPFCGGVPKIEKRTFENPNAGYSGSDYYLVVCTKCEATGKYEVFEYFSMFSKYSVEEFRKNNALRSREEDKYDEYLEVIKQKAIENWNKRI